MAREPISVLIPTFNCAAYVCHTLESVKWADEILVVDSFSTDETIEICEDFGARVIQHEYETPAKQKNWAIPYCRYEWVLQLDSDEAIEESLSEEIGEILSKAANRYHAYQIPRKNHVLGHWIRNAGIYPDYQTRLFRKNRGWFIEREVHEHLSVDGEVGRLRSHILHFGMPNISKQLRNLDRYTRHEANQLVNTGRKFHGRDLIFLPSAVFFHRYFLLQGFRDSWRGFIICLYFAIYQFLTIAKLWEIEELGLSQSPK